LEMPTSSRVRLSDVLISVRKISAHRYMGQIAPSHCSSGSLPTSVWRFPRRIARKRCADLPSACTPPRGSLRPEAPEGVPEYQRQGRAVKVESSARSGLLARALDGSLISRQTL
jgi:hypothetical protein